MIGEKNMTVNLIAFNASPVFATETLERWAIWAFKASFESFVSNPLSTDSTFEFSIKMKFDGVNKEV